MLDRPERRSLLLILALLLIASPVAGQQLPVPEDPRSKRWYDFGGLLLTLHNRGLRFQEPGRWSSDSLWDEEERQETLLIILGRASDSGPHRIERGDLLPFVANGGRLIIASDQTAINPLIRNLRVRLSSTSVSVKDPLEVPALNGFTDCPVVAIPLSPPPHPIFDRVREVALNRPTFFRRRRATPLKPVLAYPRGTSAPGRDFIRVADIGRGRVIAIADHSVFINSMLVSRDNRVFLDSCLDWLTEKGKLRKVVVINDGVLQRGPLGVRMPNIRPEDLLNTGNVNFLLNRLQRSPYWNRKIGEKADEFFEQLWYTTGFNPALMAGVGLLGFALILVVRRRVAEEREPLETAKGLPDIIALKASSKRKGKLTAAAAIALIDVARARIIALLELDLADPISDAGLIGHYPSSQASLNGAAALRELLRRREALAAKPRAIIAPQLIWEIRSEIGQALAPIQTQGSRSTRP